MALSGDGVEATEIYSKKIIDALNEQAIAPSELPAWFQSGGVSSDFYAPRFSLELESIAVPEYDAGYILVIGNWHPDISPGGTCFLAVEKAGRFTLFNIYSNFSDFGFNPGLGGSLDCSAKDATDDGVDEIIVDHWVGGRVGNMEMHIFDTSSLPPRALPFTPARNEYLTPDGFDWELLRSDDFKIHTYTEFGICDLYRTGNFRWNGEWFELTQGRIDFNLAIRNQQTFYYGCGWDISSLGDEMNIKDMISIVDDGINSLSPRSYDMPEQFDEIRLLNGVYHAFNGESEIARSVFTNIVNSPTTPDSVWVQPAMNALDIYRSQNDLYKVCSAIDICVDYFTREMGGPNPPGCANMNICDYGQAMQATISTAFPESPLEKVIENLKSVGVNIITYGWHDFDQDNRAELWFTVRHPHPRHLYADPYELWIAGQYEQGVKLLFVDEIPNLKVSYKMVDEEVGRVLTDYGYGKTVELVHHPDTGEPYITVRDLIVAEPVDQRVALFLELRQMILAGKDPEMIYNSLSAMDDQYTKCPLSGLYWDKYSANPPPGWREYDAYDCATFYYTVAFAAEMTGKNQEAVRRYYFVWAKYPDSPFATLAQWKLMEK